MCTCSFVRCSVCFQREVRFLSAGTKASGLCPVRPLLLCALPTTTTPTTPTTTLTLTTPTPVASCRRASSRSSATLRRGSFCSRRFPSRALLRARRSARERVGSTRAGSEARAARATAAAAAAAVVAAAARRPGCLLGGGGVGVGVSRKLDVVFQVHPGLKAAPITSPKPSSPISLQ